MEWNTITVLIAVFVLVAFFGACWRLDRIHKDLKAILELLRLRR